jgi:hypothetical protein
MPPLSCASSLVYDSHDANHALIGAFVVAFTTRTWVTPGARRLMFLQAAHASFAPLNWPSA